MSKKYYIITYGCQMNKSDSERIAQVLESIGYKNASKINEADLIVVNMCSVRQSAVDRVYGLQPKFESLKTKNYQLKTVLTGCILKKDRKKFAKFFDYILEKKDLLKWPKILKKTLKNTTWLNSLTIVSELSQDRESYKESYLEVLPKYSTFPVGYVPISTGCNNFCTYCVVPFTRGPEICRPVEDIMKEVKNLVRNGYKEIWLLGQNVNRYRSKSKIKNQKSKIINFAKLLEMVNDIPGNFWIRFTSSHPKDFSEELIEVMANCKKITPYLNLPVQSGDNEILKKMNRNYKIEYYKNLVKKIRHKIPDITLSTDIIVGFPGETKKQFENTKKLMEEIKYDMAYISQYSPRPGTAAAKMKNNLLSKEKKEREKTLTKVLKKIALSKNKKYIGKIVEVLSTEWKNDFLIGKSFHYKTVKFRGTKSLIGKFVKVKIIAAQAWGLKGKLIKKVSSNSM